MVDPSLINDDIIKPLMYNSPFIRAEETSDIPGMDEIRDSLLSVGDVQIDYTLDQVIESCLSGDAVLMAEGFKEALGISAKGWDKRAVTESNTETVIRGPREGFTENLRTNTAMIRRKIKKPGAQDSHHRGRKTHAHPDQYPIYRRHHEPCPDSRGRTPTKKYQYRRYSRLGLY